MLFRSVNKSANLGNNIATQPTGAQFLVDKLQQARAEVIDEVLQYLGTSVANTEKQEQSRQTTHFVRLTRMSESYRCRMKDWMY